MKAKFTTLFKHVRDVGYYKPRDYQTIGGFWTTDTWILENPDLDLKITARLEDEGWTSHILTETLDVVQSGLNDLVFYKGTEENLLDLYNKLFPTS